METFWTYFTNSTNTLRYVLGKKGEHNLLCVGVNPSTAAPQQLDRTTQSVNRLALNNGFDGWMMLNIYPLRATNPDDLPLRSRKAYHQQNLAFIEQTIQANGTTLWAAWGNLVEKRPYLKTYLREIGQLTLNLDCRWVCLGPISKKGHPHHPLYLKSTEKMRVFDMREYLDNLGKG